MAISRSHTWHLLTNYMLPQRTNFVLLAVTLLSSIGLQLVNPQIVRLFIDSATGNGGSATPPHLIMLALAYIGIALLAQGMSVAATYLSEKVGWGATNRLRSDLALHCLRLDMPFHNMRTSGEMIERIDGDILALSTFFSQFVIRIFGSALLMLGILIILFLEDWRVGLALTLFTLLAIVILARSREIAVPALTAERETSAELFGLIEERLAGLDDIRANGGGHYAMRRLHEALRSVFFKGRRGALLGSVITMITFGLFALGYALALGLGGYLYVRGAVTIGTVYLFFDYVNLLRQPIQQIAEQLKEFQKALAGMSRVQELFRLRPSIVGGAHAKLPRGPLAVEFRAVGFAYNPPARVLDGVSFKLEAGQVLGVLGRTGSGKTTLTRLLFRLYEAQHGTIALGGISIGDVPLADLRQRIGIVTQDVQLFQASVRDNLTLFDNSIGDEQMIAVLHDLGLGAWLAQLPDGLDSEIRPGALSAGEAQLVAFARIFLKDPGLVIMDEASSRLDPATERLIERAIDKLLAHRTAIIIAHRLQTVQRADEILILEHGTVREHGMRRELANDAHSRFAGLLRTGLEDVLA